jgi:hypothetical protein
LTNDRIGAIIVRPPRRTKAQEPLMKTTKPTYLITIHSEDAGPKLAKKVSKALKKLGIKAAVLTLKPETAIQVNQLA